MSDERTEQPKPVVVKMIKIVITTSEGRIESTIKAPHATNEMLGAAFAAVAAMCAVADAPIDEAPEAL